MGLIEVEIDGVGRKMSRTYANRPSPYPDSSTLEKDFVVEKYLMKGLMPDVPFVSKETPVVAFGSCFANNISKHLDDRGYNVLTKKQNKAYVTKMGDGMVHTHAIRQQFEWAWEGKFPTAALWEGYDHTEFGYSEEVKADTKALFDEAEVFIITLGLSEIWYDEPTGEVFWRAPPAKKLDPERHKFRVATYQETKDNIYGIRNLIAKYRPSAKVVFTVSPIPLAASFRPMSCLSANAASKAIIRAAVDEFYRETKDKDPNLFYFPSYDIVLYAFDNQCLPDRRHVNLPVLDFNMKVFERYFCSPGASDKALLKSYKAARAYDKEVGKNGQISADEFYRKKAERRKQGLAERATAENERLAARAKVIAARVKGLTPTQLKRREERAEAMLKSRVAARAKQLP